MSRSIITAITTSLIICTRNRPHDIVQALESITQQTISPTEIIIVDSSTKKLTQNPRFSEEFQQKNFPNSNLLYFHTKPGLTYQRNYGVNQAQGNYIFFFDDDVILSQTYLETMLTELIKHPTCLGGMGTITSISSYKPWVNKLRALFFLQRNYSSGKFTFSGMPTHPYGSTKTRYIEVLGGCGMVFKKTVFLTHRFDEQLKRYGYMEDCDFSYRVSRDGPLLFIPAATLEHRESPLARDTIIDNKAMFIANYSYLFFKNFYPKNRLSLLAYTWSIIGLFAEALFIIRSPLWLKGYYKGILYTWYHKSNYPYLFFE